MRFATSRRPSGTLWPLWLALALPGCTSMHYYEGPTRASAELAQVYISTYEEMSVQVTSIDGQADSFSYKKIIFLPPGEHRLGLETEDYVDFDDINGKKFRGHFSLTFNAKPGKAYIFQSTETVKNRLRAENQLCVYEEDQNNPNRRIWGLTDFRYPAKDALKLACNKVEIRTRR
jgi:hypothetical protein